MHLQIKASPGTTADNIRMVVDTLADAGINIEAIAPDFDPPHVRVLVAHNDPYDRNDATDPFNRALTALRGAGLKPQAVRAIEPVTMHNTPAALKTVLDTLESRGLRVESILVLPGAPGGQAMVSFGVADVPDEAWAAKAMELKDLIAQ